jgi:hypothetical protein
MVFRPMLGLAAYGLQQKLAFTGTMVYFKFDGVFQIKQYASLYPKKFIEDALKDAPGGVSIALEGTNHEVPLVAIGYRYSRKTILFFIMTKNSGSLSEGEPYEMKYTDNYGNICTQHGERPDVISKVFCYFQCD